VLYPQFFAPEPRTVPVHHGYSVGIHQYCSATLKECCWKHSTLALLVYCSRIDLHRYWMLIGLEQRQRGSLRGAVAGKVERKSWRSTEAVVPSQRTKTGLLYLYQWSPCSLQACFRRCLQCLQRCCCQKDWLIAAVELGWCQKVHHLYSWVLR
jgi:hypothetical protein